MLLLNAFSLNMVSTPVTIKVTEIPLEEASRLMKEEGFFSVVGHADTAAVYSTLLGVEVPFNRSTVCLDKGDVAVVGQYTGPRLPEGATTLPEGAEIRWLLVEVQ